jgi:hypothetical protein
LRAFIAFERRHSAELMSSCVAINIWSSRANSFDAQSCASCELLGP